MPSLRDEIAALKRPDSKIVRVSGVYDDGQERNDTLDEVLAIVDRHEEEERNRPSFRDGVIWASNENCRFYEEHEAQLIAQIEAMRRRPFDNVSDAYMVGRNHVVDEVLALLKPSSEQSLNPEQSEAKSEHHWMMSKTQRGFARMDFKDYYGSDCSLQKSSIIEPECVWLGAGKDRMHLTQDHVRRLLPYLQHFVDTGELEQISPPVRGEHETVSKPEPREERPARCPHFYVQGNRAVQCTEPVHEGEWHHFAGTMIEWKTGSRHDSLNPPHPLLEYLDEIRAAQQKLDKTITALAERVGK